MASSLTHQLHELLEAAEVCLELERRGRDPHPGRPDSVIWLRPDTVPVGRLVPLLVELEGARNTDQSFHESKKDASQFAKRHDPEERSPAESYQYALCWPTLERGVPERLQETDGPISPEGPAPMTVSVEYELFAVPATSVTGQRDATDADLHKALRLEFWRAWKDSTTPEGFSSRAEILTSGDTEIVTWEVGWTLPHVNEGTVVVPFIVQAGATLERVLTDELAPISLPLMVAINGSPAAKETTLTRDTGVRFPSVSDASVTNTNGSDRIKQPKRAGMDISSLGRSNGWVHSGPRIGSQTND